jgi:hypothetical protein
VSRPEGPEQSEKKRMKKKKSVSLSSIHLLRAGTSCLLWFVQFVPSNFVSEDRGGKEEGEGDEKCPGLYMAQKLVCAQVRNLSLPIKQPSAAKFTIAANSPSNHDSASFDTVLFHRIGFYSETVHASTSLSAAFRKIPERSSHKSITMGCIR